MLAGRTGFNNEALKDTYVRGLPHLILQKVFTQTTLPMGLDGWKTVVRNLDRLHRGLMELKRSTAQPNPLGGHSSQSTGCTNASATASTSQSPQVIMSPQTSDTSAPMDIGQHMPQVETRTCYNCNKPGHILPNCPEPQKQCVQNTGAELDVQCLVAKAVTAALDVRDKA